MPCTALVLIPHSLKLLPPNYHNNIRQNLLNKVYDQSTLYSPYN